MKNIKVFLIGMILMAGCGGTSSPNVTGTKDDPSIQAVKALFTTKAASNASVEVNDAYGATPENIALGDKMIPYLISVMNSDFYFPCSTGTRICAPDGMNWTCVFNNCELTISNFTTLLPESSPSCLTKFTLDGTFTSVQTSSYTWTTTNTLNIGVEKSDGTVIAPTPCAFNLAVVFIPDGIPDSIYGQDVVTGTICGVDISTVNSTCSM